MDKAQAIAGTALSLLVGVITLSIISVKFLHEKATDKRKEVKRATPAVYDDIQ